MTDVSRPPASRIVALVAAVAGLGVSIYLTIEHFTGSKQLACPESATINCEKVTTSQWSEILGIPVAVLGLAFFVGLLVLLLVPSRLPAVPWLRLGAVSVGLLMVFWLVFVELFKVKAICLWCTSVHVLTLIAFLAVLWERTSAVAD